MAYATVLVETLGPVARLTLNRPERANALNQAMLGEINQALDEAERDPAIRAVIVRGAGAAFSSGFDLKEQMERRPQGVEQWRPVLRKDFDTIMRFWHFPRPTIAAVRGPCLAGACELALACDITIASEDAFFGEPELKFGAGIVVDDPALDRRTEGRQGDHPHRRRPRDGRARARAWHGQPDRAGRRARRGGAGDGAAHRCDRPRAW